MVDLDAAHFQQRYLLGVAQVGVAQVGVGLVLDHAGFASDDRVVQARHRAAVGLPGLCTLSIAGDAVSTRQLTALRISFISAAGSFVPAFFNAASTRSRKTLWSSKSASPSASRSAVAHSARRPAGHHAARSWGRVAS